MADNNDERLKTGLLKKTTIAAGVIFFVLVISLLFMTTDIYYGLRNGDFRLTGFRGEPNMTVNEIQPWMTFEYINRVFKLPPDYLKERLKVSDLKYPKVELKNSAKRSGISPQEYTAEVRRAVSDY